MTKAGFRPAERGQRRVGADGFVPREGCRRAFGTLEFHRQDLGVEAPLGRRACGSAVAVERKGILGLARHVIFGGDDFGRLAHVPILERAPQAVVHHGVHGARVAQAIAAARPVQQVRRVGHRLHAAGHGDVDVAGGDALGGEHHGLESGAAHLVDGQGGNGVGEARVQRRLARGSLAQSGRHHVAEDAFLDGTRLHAGAAHGFPHDERAELRRGES